MTPTGRAVAMLMLYLETDGGAEVPELEEMVDTIPVSELPETIWELLSCARAIALEAPTAKVVEALQSVALAAAHWDFRQ